MGGQMQFCKAAEYTQWWFNEGTGERQDVVHVYFVCVGGLGRSAENKCHRVIGSVAWYHHLDAERGAEHKWRSCWAYQGAVNFFSS